MALLWIEGFEGIGTTTGSAPSPTNVLARKYSVIANESSMRVQTGRLAGYCLNLTGAGQWVQPATLTTNATMVLGAAFKFTSVNALVGFLNFYDGATQGMNLYMAGGGEISVRRGTTVLATTSGLGLTVGAWYYIEFKVLCHGSTGTYELRVDGVNKLSASSQNTKAGSNNYHTTFLLAEGAVLSIGPYIDDLYCLDGSGSANNDFLGNHKVIAIVPDGDVGGYTDFTTSTGADHYALVDENPVNDNTDYVESSGTNETDLWDYTAAANVGVIAGIQINTMARETDATSFNLKTVIKSDTTVDADAGQAVGGTSFKSLRRISEVDPFTAVPWTTDGINAAAFGIRVG